ncbi:MAG TPA: porphobilinogen synthase [bacterium]|nr:porphobilinogen synthase [bacterium]
MAFPIQRLRRLRRTETLRRLVRETTLHVDDLIYPLFVTHGRGVKQEISSMPGQYRMSVDRLLEEVDEAHSLGVKAVILFGIPDRKDERGSEAYNPEGIVQQAIRSIKKAIPAVAVVTDVCVDEYTSHGHCGILRDGEVDNDLTLEVLGEMALSHAVAGADLVAPSDMMDGRVAHIRKRLDESGLAQVPIMSYAAKYASCFYGPFREAADSAPQFGDRRSYQMDSCNVREALREVELDVEEGADIIMVKPALAYLDVLARIRDRFPLPLAAYNVSGEYSMIMAAGNKGWIDRDRAVWEVLHSIKRAGADLILTYFAKEVASWIHQGKSF